MAKEGSHRERCFVYKGFRILTKLPFLTDSLESKLVIQYP